MTRRKTILKQKKRTVILGIALVALVVFTVTHTLTVCYTFTFSGDLLDPGDHLSFVGPAEGAGFRNAGREPQATRTLCFDAWLHPRAVLELLFRRPAFLVEHGSVNIESVQREVALAWVQFSWSWDASKEKQF